MRKAKPILLAVATLAVLTAFFALARPGGEGIAPRSGGTPMADKVTKSDAEWQQLLSPEQYHVARRKGTERAFTGEYWNTKDDGVYECVCCGQPLFDAATKFDSGTGWPSYWAPIAEGNVALISD